MAENSATPPMAQNDQMNQIKPSANRLPLLAIIGLVLLIAGPWIFDTYLLNILIKAFFMAIVAVMVDVLWGHTGYLTFGQSAFFGIGAYAVGLIFTHSGFSILNAFIAIAIAMSASMGVAWLVGWLSFYRGASPFFATVMSLVLPIVLVQLVLSGGVWTGSSSGLTGYETIDLSINTWYWISGTALAAVSILAWYVVRSDGGRILSAIRDNESRCSYLGIDTSKVKTILFVCTAGISGIAGFGYGAFSGVVAPELGGFVLGTELIIWVALGGRGTLWGPLIGAILINVVTAYLGSSMPFAWQLILGASFVIVIVLLPQGLIPVLLKPFGLGRYVHRKPKLISRNTQVVSDATDASPAIQMEGVAKHYGRLKVLEGIDFKANAGELVGLIGPNGAGKTTLMRCISDGADRSAGAVAICGNDIQLLPPDRCVKFGLGRKFQNANIFESLTVAECLRIAGTIRIQPSLFKQDSELSLPQYALDIVVTTGLSLKLDVVARDLSHGEQQALELAMVLAQEPKLVLLDEPTAGLTKTERTQIGAILSSLSHKYGLCCLLVEHDLDFVEEIATRIVVLHQGRIVMEGSFKEVVDSELVKTIYAGSAHSSKETV